MGALPDTSWPVAKQLDHAVTTIKRNVKLIIDTKAQSEVTKVVCRIITYLLYYYHFQFTLVIHVHVYK